LGGTFIFSLALSAQTFTTLYDFSSLDYGAYDPSVGGVIVGPRGELYGVTGKGGRWNYGTVYELVPPSSSGGAWKEVVLHSFNGEDGAYPNWGLTMGPSGTLYGVAGYPGASGAAFRLDPPTGTSADWTYAVICKFTETDGEPYSPLVFGPPPGYSQSLFGITADGGGSGIVYELAPPAVAGGAWTQTTLYTFLGGSSSGSFPVGSLVVGTAGKLIGVASTGGYSGECCGVVYSLTPPAALGAPWTEQTIHTFNGVDGNYPQAGLVRGPGGVLFGTTFGGGAGAAGTVFALLPPVTPGAPMTETILYAFTGTTGNGFSPNSLALAANGVLYGTTEYGGPDYGGTVFELAPPASPGAGWTQTTLYYYNVGPGFEYGQRLAVAPDGTVYGTAPGGTNDVGMVFAITP
ncbi:MAG TPA: choice-of-anchor tandem repeat GloVer-containing protein, partial [Bryobacteraceae bacterium]|nr:choice-of-anchor tandem repeat GloVer-containing protein [Bryobacteraceae bacterium]